jgi:hypothetical protein
MTSNPLYLKTQFVPRSKHLSPQLEKLIVECCMAKTSIFFLRYTQNIYIYISRLRWSRGSLLVFGTQVRGFKPGHSRRIFKNEKNPQHAFLWRGSKTVCPMIPRIMWKADSKPNLSEHFSPT